MKFKLSAGSIIGIVVAFILIATLLPIGLNELENFANNYTGSNTTIVSLVTTILPILVVIGIIVGMIGGSKKD